VEVSTVNYGEAVIAQSFSLTRDTMISQTTWKWVNCFPFFCIISPIDALCNHVYRSSIYALPVIIVWHPYDHIILHLTTESTSTILSFHYVIMHISSHLCF
jgi:hypothetical protein